MKVMTYRARSVQEAMQKVREQLGPEARVVQTRELKTGIWERIALGRRYEVRTRSDRKQVLPLKRHGEGSAATTRLNTKDDQLAFRQRVRQGLDRQALEGYSLLESIAPVKTDTSTSDKPPAMLFELMTELVEAEVSESTARDLIEELAMTTRGQSLSLDDLRERLVRNLADDVSTSGPIQSLPGQRRIVALVGPTGVGKTTTIAKLAANLRLREQRRVGLITVDTYRVAAVEQLRTYAEIMDLPMEVVTTPREMGDAVTRLSDEDVILIDTAGRSPRDAVQLQQLKAMLGEASPDEVHLVLSGVSSEIHLRQIVSKFQPLGCTSLIVTKLDEASGLGNLVGLFRHSKLAASYLTCGQCVPDDIVLANKNTMLPVLVGQQPIASLV